MIRISSSSWFIIWIGLEINLLSFIPLMINLNNLFSREAILKYFLTQTLASRTLLFSIIFYSFIFEFNLNYQFKRLLNILFCSSLLIKIGIAPFHFWFPNVIEGLNWINNIILITWQKIAPFIISSFCLNNYFLLTCVILSSFVGAIGGLNQTSLRKIIAYSSINHLRWIIIAILNNENLWKIYFIFYCFLSISIIFLFINFNLININQTYLIFNNKNFLKILIFIPLLSLGGLPPFLGFFPKWLIIDELINFNLIWLLLILICCTLITLYFYIRICYSSLIFNHFIIIWNWKNFFNFKNLIFLSLISFFSIFGILIINIISLIFY